MWQIRRGLPETVTGQIFLPWPALSSCPAPQLALLRPVLSCAVKNIIGLPCTAGQGRTSCRAEITWDRSISLLLKDRTTVNLSLANALIGLLVSQYNALVDY